MNYEKAYKEALERAKTIHNEHHAQCADIMTKVFPELAESEDEKIRKALISVLKSDFENDTTIHDISVGVIISWLEKQSKQKPIEEYVVPETPIKDSEAVTSRMKYIDENLKPIAKFVLDYANWDLRKDEWNHPVATVPLFRVLDALVQKGKQYSEEYSVVDNNTEPKFRNGQWIVWQDRCYKVNYNGCGYELVDQNGLSTSSNYEDVDKNAHIWDVTKDAKDGDVLATHECCVIFKEIDGLNIKCYCTYHYMGFNPSFYVDTLQNKDAFHPATKEQRDLLFKKIKETGYEWDAEKKELKKIELKPFDYENANIQQKDFAPKAEPKFKVGDLIVHDMSDGRKVIRQIVEMTNKSYILDGKSFNAFYFDDLENDYHLWTIQDAKDGDVLATECFIFIFKNIDNDNGVHYYCHYEIDKHEDYEQFGVALPQSLMGRVGNNFSHYSPASKEQRNFLFQKMEEAGYTWDAKKKQLIKNM